MKLLCALALVLAASPVASAPQDAVNLGDLVEQGEEWLRQNVDEHWLDSLQQVDHEKVQEFFRAIQQRFQSDYVLDLAALQQTATVVLPLLVGHEEAEPYAAWLRARLDYFDVAEELRLTNPPQKTEPGQPAKPMIPPTQDSQGKVWRRRLAQRPLPPGAKSYVPRLKPIFASQQVPDELVWLAEVESSFVATARSPAGAAGLFQLMPATAKENGLDLWPRDERFQPEKNARAAAAHLKNLHRQFGDWPLALAAYNAGQGRIQTLLRKHNARTFVRIATHLPAETQMYVPRFAATLMRREGLTLEQLKAPQP